MKTIIVPVDFSVESLQGLKMALLFASKTIVNIQMVYVQKSGSDYRPGTFEEEHRYAEREFENIMDKYKSGLTEGSKLRYIIKKGKIYQEIVEQAESYKNSIICASTHGASGFEEFFIGSNAYKIISSTDDPVITVRKKTPADIKKVVIPVRLHVDTRQKVPKGLEIAEIFGAEVHLISVTTSRNKQDTSRLNAYLQQSNDYAKRKGFKPVVKKLVGESTATLVHNYCNAVDADLVAIMTSQRGSMALLTGSYAQQIVSRSDTPVLSITAKEKHIPAGFATRGYR